MMRFYSMGALREWRDSCLGSFSKMRPPSGEVHNRARRPPLASLLIAALILSSFGCAVGGRGSAEAEATIGEQEIYFLAPDPKGQYLRRTTLFLDACILKGQPLKWDDEQRAWEQSASADSSLRRSSKAGPTPVSPVDYAIRWRDRADTDEGAVYLVLCSEGEGRIFTFITRVQYYRPDVFSEAVDSPPEKILSARKFIETFNRRMLEEVRPEFP